MSNKIRIALLCNSKMAIPAMQQLLESGTLCALACSEKNPELSIYLKSTADSFGLPFRVIKRKYLQESIAGWLFESEADTVFVMTFPWRIPAELLRLPRLGFFNFHYGLLPEMRGADPIFESIRQQKKTAGLSIHVMDKGFDTGPVVLQERVAILPDETYGMLSSRLAWLGQKLSIELLKSLQAGDILPDIQQDHDKAAYWPRIPAESLHVNWGEMTAAEIKALVNACNPIARGVPVSINNWKIGLCSVAEIILEGDASPFSPGAILALDGQNGLIVLCKDGKGLRIEVAYTEEGVFPGYSLSKFGLTAGMQFN